ncbi:hypothetical protein PAXRUDRAFT_835285 [Paxillus rubicundulus Ve08.2h10]|uniref:Uncharacterized protein n=1 Tax=Paxillus rubicundulus Ve08.2h10 TaxID=930991 RepID=A0A0D0DFR3_9AGAM|nr:hypothetical protein PAXRUDRAFT_835285 [Paxillus rubicundulus Ve08.2h10]
MFVHRWIQEKSLVTLTTTARTKNNARLDQPWNVSGWLLYFEDVHQRVSQIMLLLCCTLQFPH